VALPITFEVLEGKFLIVAALITFSISGPDPVSEDGEPVAEASA
jgi:hypothetical protein